MSNRKSIPSVGWAHPPTANRNTDLLSGELGTQLANDHMQILRDALTEWKGKRMTNLTPAEMDALLNHAEQQAERIEELEAALDFYADEANWQTRDGDDPYPLVDNDGGDIARDARKGGG